MGRQDKQNQDQQSAKIAQKEAWNIASYDVPVEEGKKRFHDFDLPSELMHGIADLGYQYCSPIQAASLPISLDGLDVIGKAQTGTGKTAAFLISTITQLLTNPPEQAYASEPRVLIIAPTRELVMQIGNDARDFCKHTSLNVVTVVGGMDYEQQEKQLRNGVVDILVATPGRLIDFMNRQAVFLDQIETLIIDEADRMLDMGFIPDVRRIVRATPAKEFRQTLFFSATFTAEVMSLTEQWTMDPQTIIIEPESVATDTVEQVVYMVSTSDKLKLVQNIVKQEGVDRVIIFANRRDICRKLVDRLQKNGVKSLLLSGEVAQQKRVKTLESFREGTVKVMVATDVAGRGIHIDGISHVINYTLPEDPEDYVHRIGRTGRAGTTGISISFACEDDAFLLPELEAFIGKKLECKHPSDDLLA
jgi:ATP-dependent RNA helicase RhlB